MWTAILALLPFLQQIINWWNNRKQAQTDQNTAVSNAQTAHQSDGAQSVADQLSSDAQNAAIQAQIKKLDQTEKPK